MPVGGTSLLLTKLTMPPPRVHTLPRERLLALVPAVLGTRLVLLSAPAGFGKTTFLSTWCHALATQHGATVAWVALDAGDNDPARFLAYLTAAVAQAMALPDGEGDGVAAAGTSMIDSELVLTRLLNTLAALGHDLVLILDDYHLITTPAVHVAVAFLLDHLPDRVRIAIGSRADPPLPLARP
jgi:LuxR family transcriptional regulator, maltose regulon positive regulatory protein